MTESTRICPVRRQLAGANGPAMCVPRSNRQVLHQHWSTSEFRHVSAQFSQRAAQAESTPARIRRAPYRRSFR